MPVREERDHGLVAEEDQLRAQWYRLLAAFLAAPPQQDLLDAAGGLLGDQSEFGQATDALAHAARAASVEAASEEYHDLFIGVGRGELVPFGSYYLTGFLHERPLAALRQDMARLGLRRADDVYEPEDHIASLCEIMAGLIEGSFAAPADLTSQRRFFGAHLEPWAEKFFEDLQDAKAARLYRPLGTLGRHFMAIELASLEMGPEA